jgi:hypothetical protein
MSMALGQFGQPSNGRFAQRKSQLVMLGGISHNRSTRTQMEKQDEFYGIKVRHGKGCHLQHNTIEVNFSMEFPFANDEDNEGYMNLSTGQPVGLEKPLKFECGVHGEQGVDGWKTQASRGQ